MAIEFYYMVDSPPCMAVQVAAAALGITFTPKLINYENNDHLSPEFVKLNPQHTVPTIKDGDFVLWESRPIMAYLVEKYGKDDSLYPKDPVKRAVVDQRLYFDMGTLYQRFSDYYYPQVLAKAPADPVKFKRMVEAFEFLEIFLTGQKFAAGQNMTIADLTLLITVSCYVDGGAKWTLDKFPNVTRWYEECKTVVPGYDESTQEGLKSFRTYFADIPAPQFD